MFTLCFIGSQEVPIHDIVSSTLKKTLNARRQPVSLEINNLLLLLLLLLFSDDDDDADADDDDGIDVLAVGVFVLELKVLDTNLLGAIMKAVIEIE